jgi:translocator protein
MWAFVICGHSGNGGFNWMNSTRSNLLRNGVGLLACFGITFLAAGIGAYASINAKSFYASLMRPVWAPPGWLFGPAWGLLYCLMGAAAFCVWLRRGDDHVKGALTLFVSQLILNSLWTWIFFVWRMGSTAFAEILLLWILILCTLVSFWRVRAIAGALLIPYLLWVTFAALLTFATWRMNPNLL